MKDLLVYKCYDCGYVLEVLDIGKRTYIERGASYARSLTVADAILVCCDKPMVLLKPNTEDASSEKHVPVITFEEDKVRVKIGSVSHPMAAEHYIKWITVLAGDKVLRAQLEPGDSPEAVFHIGKENKVKAYAYCNLHELWMSEADR